MEEKTVRRVYLSAPISGYDLAERKHTFAAMEKKLRVRGYDVCNPMGTQWESGLTAHDYMRKDIEMLLTCDAIMLMDGWNKSAGCHTELCVAIAIGIEIWFEDLSESIKL